MLSNRVYCTDLPNREDKLNKMQLISVHSYSLFSELPRSPFCPHFHHLGSSATTSDGSTGTSGTLQSSVHFSTKCRKFSQQAVSSELILKVVFSRHHVWNFPLNLHFHQTANCSGSTSLTGLFFCPKHALGLQFAFLMGTLTLLCEGTSPD